VVSKQYFTESLTTEVEAFPVTAAAYYSEFQFVILGDGFGNVEIWSISEIVDVLRKSKVLKINERKRESRKHQVNVYPRRTGKIRPLRLSPRLRNERRYLTRE
jgi:hypothetical protein